MDWNLVLNLAALLILGAGVVRLGAIRRLRDTIGDLEKAADAKDRRVDQLEDDIKNCARRADAAEARAHEAEKAVATWEARYEELQSYTARPAVEHFQQMLVEHEKQVAVRHERMIAQLSSNGELILKSLELLARIDDQTARRDGT